VSNKIPIVRRCGATVWPIIALCIGFAAGTPRITSAHDLFTAYVQHAVHLNVSDQHVDLTLDLTFFEEWSAKERLAMDADSSGRISRLEMEAYVKKLAPRICQQVKLRVAKHAVAIAPLYEPEVDLLANDKVGPGHHRLRLSFFAVKPVEIRAGDEFVVEDSLWPKAQTLGTAQAGGGDGIAFEAAPVGVFSMASEQPSAPRRFVFRCLSSTPAKKQ
jgi:hypothetical protein